MTCRGEFRFGKMHGYGKQTFSDGTERAGLFSEGELTGLTGADDVSDKQAQEQLVAAKVRDARTGALVWGLWPKELVVIHLDYYSMPVYTANPSMERSSGGSGGSGSRGNSSGDMGTPAAEAVGVRISQDDAQPEASPGVLGKLRRRAARSSIATR